MIKDNPGMDTYPDSKVREANMGLIWGRQDPGWPHELCYLDTCVILIWNFPIYVFIEQQIIKVFDYLEGCFNITT